MKTYWLEGRECRLPLTKVISPQLQPGTELEWERAADIRDSIAEHSTAQHLNNKEAQARRVQSSEIHLPNSLISSGPNSLVNSSGNLIAIQASTPSVRSSQVPLNGPATTMTSPVEERRMYSPVTFQDVARRSIANSPNKVDSQRGKFYSIKYTLSNERITRSWFLIVNIKFYYISFSFSESRSNSTSVPGIWTDAESLDPPRTADSLNSSIW